MGLFKIWKDHVTQYSNRYREVQNADGTITHEAVEGEVTCLTHLLPKLPLGLSA